MQQAGLNCHERRDKQRLPFNRLVQLESPTAGGLQLQGVDYSPCGVAVHSPCQLPIGEQLVLRFPVGRNQQTEMEVHGEVRHHCQTTEGFLIGIRFMEKMDPATRSAC